MSQVHRLAILLTVLIVIFLPRPASAADAVEWGEPVQVGTELPSSWFPDIDADPTGKVRVVWSASLVEGDLNETHEVAGAVVVSELTESSWSVPADIFVMDGGIASRPLIASDGAWAHLLVRYPSLGGQVRVMYTRAPLSADLHNTHSWSEPVPLSSDESYWAQLRALPNGDLVAIFNQMTNVTIDGVVEKRTVLYSRRSTDYGATWSAAVRVSDTDEHIARTSLAASPDGRVLVAAWDIGYDNMSATGEPSGVETAVSADFGKTWSEPQSFPGDYEQSTVVTDGNRAMLVYRSTVDDRLRYRVSRDHGQSWSDQQDIPDAVSRPYSNKHNFDKLSLAIDGDGDWLLAWVGADPDAPKGLSVMVASYAEDRWAEPEIVARPDGYPEYPRLAVAFGNQIHLAYFVRDVEYDVGHYTMWIAHGVSAAQPVAPQRIEPASVAPTPTRLVPTPVIYERATAAPVPTPNPSLMDLRDSPQASRSAPVRSIAMVTTGGLLLVLALFVVLRRFI